MKKNDIILALIVLLLAGAGFHLYMGLGKQSAGTITVTVDGSVYGTYSLEKDQEILIHHTNYLIIENGQADMVEADCPDQICVDHKGISKNKETIVCLPNKVIVEVVGGKTSDLDGVTN